MYNKENSLPDFTESIDAMRNVEEDANAARPVPAGWMIQVGHEYYTGTGHSSLERWTSFPKFAKVYRRQGWAQKIATQWGGQIVAVAASPSPQNGSGTFQRKPLKPPKGPVKDPVLSRQDLHDLHVAPHLLPEGASASLALCGGRRAGCYPSAVGLSSGIPSPRGLPHRLVLGHLLEVCLLSQGVMLQPLSVPLQNGIRFLQHPLPTVLSARLAAHFPSGRTMGLPRST